MNCNPDSRDLVATLKKRLSLKGLRNGASGMLPVLHSPG